MMSALIAYPRAAPALAGSGRIKAKIRMKLIDHQNHRTRSSVRAPGRSAPPPVAVNVSGWPVPELSGVAKQHATAEPKADHGYRRPGGEPYDAGNPGVLRQLVDIVRFDIADQHAL